ncbi:hypothetical protein J437_LFUL009882 [Ladona fulva]|uniref:TPX2 central domain-containing protein n=1 Tax=Ladona fulva TaxID=123851 RepID=A0A8K0K9F6_LADFU|nr:hypothetical protein J437_LFUL009882 [Ladona fulva]
MWKMLNKGHYIYLEVTYCKRKRVDSSQQPNKYVCMAEAVEKFQRTTPARFHTKPRYSKFEFKGKRLSHLKTTVPMSPHLQVIKRNRPVTALSRWQIEDMEVEEMKKHQVKARPVNEKIFNPMNIDTSHQSHVIEMKPFNLTQWKRKVRKYSSAIST